MDRRKTRKINGLKLRGFFKKKRKVNTYEKETKKPLLTYWGLKGEGEKFNTLS